MKKTIIFFGSVLLLNLFACKAQQQRSGMPVPTSEPTVYKGVTDSTCAVEVSFGSAGGGIDGSSLQKILALIDSKQLQSSRKPVGREGETRICLPLTELKGKEKKELIDALKKIVKEGQLCSVSIR